MRYEIMSNRNAYKGSNNDQLKDDDKVQGCITTALEAASEHSVRVRPPFIILNTPPLKVEGGTGNDTNPAPPSTS